MLIRGFPGEVPILSPLIELQEPFSIKQDENWFIERASVDNCEEVIKQTTYESMRRVLMDMDMDACQWKYLSPRCLCNRD